VGEWRKVIPEGRDRLQSRVLVWVVAGMLGLCAIYNGVSYVLYIQRMLQVLPNDVIMRAAIWHFLTPLIVSLTFGFLVWRTKSATPGGIFCGMLICYSAIPFVHFSDLARSPIVPIIGLFLLTFTATGAGRKRKVALGVAEDRRGRNAAQVIANLGMAGLVAGTPWLSLVDAHLGPAPWINHPWFEPVVWAESAMFLAALCEATADTVSSEIGQAFGGTPILLTSFRRVPAGTDGAISLLGTGAGVVAATLVALTVMWPMGGAWWEFRIGLIGGVAGFLFDSLLGATVERKGWLGNDLVNFCSTTFSVLVALVLAVVFLPQR